MAAASPWWREEIRTGWAAGFLLWAFSVFRVFAPFGNSAPHMQLLELHNVSRPFWPPENLQQPRSLTKSLTTADVKTLLLLLVSTVTSSQRSKMEFSMFSMFSCQKKPSQNVWADVRKNEEPMKEDKRKEGRSFTPSEEREIKEQIFARTEHCLGFQLLV